MAKLKHILRFTAIAVLAGSISAGLCHAHDFWIDTESFAPETNSTLNVRISGGHRFPELELSLAARMLDGLIHRAVDGTRQTLDVNSDNEQQHTATLLTGGTPGAALLELVIRNPRHERPRYLCRALLFIGGELVENMPFSIRPDLPAIEIDFADDNSQLHVSVSDSNGERVSSRIYLYHDGQRPVTRAATPSAPAAFSIAPGTKYLLTAIADNITLSLTFALPGE